VVTPQHSLDIKVSQSNNASLRAIPAAALIVGCGLVMLRRRLRGNLSMDDRRKNRELTRRSLTLAIFAEVAALAAPRQALAQDDSDKQPTPEENYAKRFPQAVHVSDVLGKAILDDDNGVIAYVQRVVRTPDGKIQFIVPYGGLFGFGQRLVAVPIETLASIGTSLLALDMPKEKFRMAPTWYGLDAQVLGPDEVIRVAVTRR
jgi:hypothetical protein